MAAILAQAAAAPAGVAILDLHLGCDDTGRRLEGADLVAPLRTLGWTVLVVSGSRDEASHAAAIVAGAAGVVRPRFELPGYRGVHVEQR